MAYFASDNTEGYSRFDLDALNAEFARRTAGLDLDPDGPDSSCLKHVAERVLDEYAYAR